jgi:hypothetical protein
MAVKWESPWTPRECPMCGEMATNHAWFYDSEAPDSAHDDRKPVSEAYEHANKKPCSRGPASS